MKVIINADDFGCSQGQNRGIIEAHRNGVVTSTTLLVNGKFFKEAVKLSKENPRLGVGVHCVLDMGQPISKAHMVKSLVNESGDFLKHKGEGNLGVDTQEVYLELKAQIEKTLKSGIKVTHMDSHHHIHMHPEIFETFVSLASEFSLPIRFLETSNNSFYLEILSKYTIEYVYCLTDFYKINLSPEYFKDMKSKTNGKKVVEIMCHPAFVDEDIMNNSTYNIHRDTEREVLTSEKTREYLSSVELVSFKDIHEKEEK